MHYLWKKLSIILFLNSIFFYQTFATEINNTELLILDKSYFFTDGRYIKQSHTQVKNSEITIIDANYF